MSHTLRMVRRLYSHCPPLSARSQQRGVALFTVLIFAAVVGGGALLYLGLGSVQAQKQERDLITPKALLRAKQALLDYVARAPLVAGSRTNQPGDLPCPNRTPVATGLRSGGCASSATDRFGRFPWVEFGLEELRDASGEPLWYAISNGFRLGGPARSFNTPSDFAFARVDALGNVSNESEVVAVIIAPGAPLAGQLRNCDVPSNCTSPANFMEAYTGGSAGTNVIGGAGARFVDAPANATFNDQVITITLAEMHQAIARKVGIEVASCLRDYERDNLGRYPWAARMAVNFASNDDVTNLLVGRIPNGGTQTNLSAFGLMSAAPLSESLAATTPYKCRLRVNDSGGWYITWREHVFYAISPRHKPGTNDLRVGSYAAACRTSTTPSIDCITVGDRRNIEAVVIVSAARLASQTQPSANFSSYLEGINSTEFATGDAAGVQSHTYTRGSATANLSSFNDVIVTIP
jgi:hypothetical protein